MAWEAILASPRAKHGVEGAKNTDSMLDVYWKVESGLALRSP
jgi:hypothetical protein